MAKLRTSVSLGEDLQEQIDDYIDDDQSRSEFIRRAIRNEIARDEVDVERVAERVADLEDKTDSIEDHEDRLNKLEAWQEIKQEPSQMAVRTIPHDPEDFDRPSPPQPEDWNDDIDATNEELLDGLIQLATLFKGWPTPPEFDENSTYSIGDLETRFGGFEEAVNEARRHWYQT